MKTRNTLLLLIALAAASLFIIPGKAHAQVGVRVSFQTFYDQLGPDGSWVSYPNYGYVWIPRVGAGFRPYATNGHWVYTDDGWTWVSDYSWGWAPFHYGRWGWDDDLGWYWIPDSEWAPAWVTWGGYDNYYAWAPLGPGISFSVGWRAPANYWVSCPRQYIGVGGFGNHVIVNNNVTVINRINIINVQHNTYRSRNYNMGPAPADVQRYTHRPVQPAHIIESRSPGTTRVANGSLSIYRPAVNRQSVAEARPSHFQPKENFKPVNRPAPNNPPVNNRPTPTRPGNNTPPPAHNNRPGNPGNPGNGMPHQQQPVHTQTQRPVNTPPVQTQPVRPPQQQHNPPPQQHEQRSMPMQPPHNNPAPMPHPMPQQQQHNPPPRPEEHRP